MKFQVQTVAAFLALVSGAAAFAPLSTQHRHHQQQQQHYQQRAATELSMANNNNNNNEKNNNMDLGKTAMSFFAASVVAVSATSGVLMPVEPAFAASSTKVEQVAAAKAPEKKLAPAAKAPEKKLAPAAKAPEKKLAPEEKNKVTAKKNLDLSEKTLKEYEKYVSDCKGADNKASAALNSQEKVAAAAKKAAITDSDKLSAAKSQKMPQTAIKELTTKSCKSSSLLCFICIWNLVFGM
jgi:hypothetical protein